MEDYNKEIEFEVKENLNPKNKIREYFQYYSFEEIKQDKRLLIFVKKWTLLGEWKFSPIDKESKIEIKLAESNKIKIKYIVESNNFISSIAFSSLYDRFLLNLIEFLNKNRNFTERNKLQLKLAKKKNYTYHLIFFVGALFSILLGVSLSKLTGINFLKFIITLIGTALIRKVLNNYLIKNNTPK